MNEIELKKVDLDIDGHIRLQCGTEVHIKPQFKLVVPDTINLENLMRGNHSLIEAQKQMKNRGIDRPLATLTGLRIVAYLYGDDAEGREIPSSTRDDRQRSCMRTIELYNQSGNGSLD